MKLIKPHIPWIQNCRTNKYQADARVRHDIHMCSTSKSKVRGWFFAGCRAKKEPQVALTDLNQIGCQIHTVKITLISLRVRQQYAPLLRSVF
jgi:hypothetical protein